MNTAQAQSASPEDQVRASISQALQAKGGRVTVDQPGSLVVEVGGSKLSAYLAGGFRNAMKMPMLITVATSGGPGGTGLSVEIRSNGTGGGAMSGGWLGASKQGKGEAAWMQIVMGAVPSAVGAAAQAPVADPPQQMAPPPATASPQPPAAPQGPPPAAPGQFTP
jgi:hypothetical protein